MNIEVTDDLRDLLQKCGTVTLGGTETLSELRAIYEETFGEEY